MYYTLSYNLHPTTNAAAYSYSQINSYDAMGRVTSQTQNLLNASGAWVPYTVSRPYDLASHTLMQTYPSGRTVTNTYATSGRLSSFDGNLGDGTATYDGENRMRNALKSGSWSYYVYDADGKRVRRIVGGVETWQICGLERYSVGYTYNNVDGLKQVSYTVNAWKKSVNYDHSDAGYRNKSFTLSA